MNKNKMFGLLSLSAIALVTLASCGGSSPKHKKTRVFVYADCEEGRYSDKECITYEIKDEDKLEYEKQDVIVTVQPREFFYMRNVLKTGESTPIIPYVGYGSPIYKYNAPMVRNVAWTFEDKTVYDEETGNFQEKYEIKIKKDYFTKNVVIAYTSFASTLSKEDHRIHCFTSENYGYAPYINDGSEIIPSNKIYLSGNNVDTDSILEEPYRVRGIPVEDEEKVIPTDEWYAFTYSPSLSNFTLNSTTLQMAFVLNNGSYYSSDVRQDYFGTIDGLDDINSEAIDPDEETKRYAYTNVEVLGVPIDESEGYKLLSYYKNVPATEAQDFSISLDRTYSSMTLKFKWDTLFKKDASARFGYSELFNKIHIKVTPQFRSHVYFKDLSNNKIHNLTYGISTYENVDDDYIYDEVGGAGLLLRRGFYLKNEDDPTADPYSFGHDQSGYYNLGGLAIHNDGDEGTRYYNALFTYDQEEGNEITWPKVSFSYSDGSTYTDWRTMDVSKATTSIERAQTDRMEYIEQYGWRLVCVNPVGRTYSAADMPDKFKEKHNVFMLYPVGNEDAQDAAFMDGGVFSPSFAIQIE